MFAREYLTVVSRWARQRLREGANTPTQTRQLKQLVDAADALSSELKPVRKIPDNVVQLAERRRKVS